MGLGSLAVVLAWPKAYAMDSAPQGPVARLRRAAAHVPGTLVVLAVATALTAGLYRRWG